MKFSIAYAVKEKIDKTTYAREIYILVKINNQKRKSILLKILNKLKQSTDK